MSMTGSLMGYENNNELNQMKCKKSIKTLPMLSNTCPISGNGVTASMASSGAATVNSNTANNIATAINNTIGGKSRKYTANIQAERRRESCNRGHANGLWSVWYGILVVTLQAYIATRCAKRFVAYLSLPWPADQQPPKFELHACIILTGTGVLLLPIFLAATFLKLGNYANDGVKLGRHTSTCTRDPPSSLLSNAPDGTDAIWRTDLDWVVVHRDRLVFFSFMNPTENLSSFSDYGQTIMTSSSVYDDLNNNFDESTWNYRSPGNASGDDRDISSATVKSIINNNNFQHINSSISLNTEQVTVTHNSTVNNPEAATDINKSTNSNYSTLTTNSQKLRKPTSATITNETKKLTLGKNTNAKSRGKIKIDEGLSKTKLSNVNLIQRVNMTAQNLPLAMDTLSDLDHPRLLNLDIANDDTHVVDVRTISLEYLNYAMALGVYAVRYPAVFWSCNKALGAIFSVQLVFNSVQSLTSYAGMSVLYKIQVVGPHKVLSLMRHRTTNPTIVPPGGIQRIIGNLFGDNSHLLLNPHVTLVLFALSSLLVLCSSMVTYLYAYGRFAAFLEQERQRQIIMAKNNRRNSSGWSYFTHCAALCVFLALTICNAPLLCDYTVIYRGSLDGVILACILGTILHLILWIVLWFFLTIKRNWIFKVRVTIARATVRSSRAVKLITDVNLLASKSKNANGDDDDDDEEDIDDEPNIDQDGSTSSPLLVVGNGMTYSIAEASPKKAIMTVIQRAVIERKAKRKHGEAMIHGNNDTNVESDEQIYWLRPKLRPSPAQSPNGNGSTAIDKNWLNKKLRPKVTFNDLPSTSGPRNKGKRRGNTEGGPEDDGDYATLRELPLINSIDVAEDLASEENKLLECVNDDQVTYYANGNRDLQPFDGDPSPTLTPEPLPDPNVSLVELPPPPPPPPPTTTATTTNNQLFSSCETTIDRVVPTSGSIVNHTHLPPQVNIHMPRCLRYGDAGMPQEQLTPRSDSSNSPAAIESLVMNSNTTEMNYCEIGLTNHSNTSSNSETSSGVHSNVSNVSQMSNALHERRATSVDDLSERLNNDDRNVEYREIKNDNNHWRSCSLQRGSQPPTMRNINFNTNVPQQRLSTSSCQSFTSKFGAVETNPAQSQQSGCPAIILENANQATVVIRRRSSRPKLTEPLNPNEIEPFSRSTNMRMTSFTECSDFRGGIHASSATLPHYPTQPVVPTYPHCSTMPLPHGGIHNNHDDNNRSINGGNSDVGVGTNTSRYSGMNGSNSGGGSCGSVPQNTTIIPPLNHTTLPSYHNGMRIMHNNVPPNNVYVKRYPPNHNLPPQLQQWSLSSGHHTFPQPLQNKFFTGTQLPQMRQNDRDSANFSMASSGDSDICVQPQ
ncbi:hypothetical protein PV327_009885 [Microctonus hyperodae]|uniref:Protein tincar n=1 Tax=Microctonus hyperodae TaxID=165561 RepID=A0AA39F1W7_MICHY|nr:hypothetical protein PV327_009885 [Microctonus hyperodae]